MNTPIEKQAEILAELWMDYRDEGYFQEFFQYADLGFPLSYLLVQNVVTRNAETDKFISDTCETFLGLCGIEVDTGLDILDEMFVNRADELQYLGLVGFEDTGFDSLEDVLAETDFENNED